MLYKAALLVKLQYKYMFRVDSICSIDVVSQPFIDPCFGPNGRNRKLFTSMRYWQEFYKRIVHFQNLTQFHNLTLLSIVHFQNLKKFHNLTLLSIVHTHNLCVCKSKCEFLYRLIYWTEFDDGS